MTDPSFGDPWLDPGRPSQGAELAIHPETIRDLDGVLAFMSETATGIREGRGVPKVDVVLAGVTLGPVDELVTFWNGDLLRVTVRFDALTILPLA